jgi:hypothetical protein
MRPCPAQLRTSTVRAASRKGSQGPWSGSGEFSRRRLPTEFTIREKSRSGVARPAAARSSTSSPASRPPGVRSSGSDDTT